MRLTITCETIEDLKDEIEDIELDKELKTVVENLKPGEIFTYQVELLRENKMSNKSDVLDSCTKVIINNFEYSMIEDVKRYLNSGAIDIESYDEARLTRVLLTAALHEVLENYEPPTTGWEEEWDDIQNLRNF